MEMNAAYAILSFILSVGFLTILYFVSSIIYWIWYNKNYITKESTPEHDKGWNKCWECKKAEPTMFYTYNIFGRVYKCSKHTFNDKESN